MSLNRIFPECYADKTLVSKVLQVEDQFHYCTLSMQIYGSAGFGGVSKGLENYADNDVIIGIIDNDFVRMPKFL